MAITMTVRQRQLRDRATGQYAWDGDMSRMCVCGHTLGVHCAGGFDCMNGSGCPGATGEPCDCQKFQLSRKKRGVLGE